MTVDVTIRCDVATCRAVVATQDVRSVQLDARRSLEACSDSCADALRQRHGVVAPAYVVGADIGRRAP